MDHPIVMLPLDLMGSSPNNHVGSEEHLLVKLDGFPYKIITLFHGGFYTRGLKVFDEQLNKLQPNVDYICTYKHLQISERTGLEVCSAIVFINPEITGSVYTTAQMVGGDVAFSFTVIQDYINFFNTQVNYTPTWVDYLGQEPIWGPGELVQNRWGLDMYQPMNNELENISRRLMLGAVESEDRLRQRIRDRLTDFLGRFNDTLDRHILDLANPHNTTAELVTLGNVRNLTVASTAESNAMTVDNKYLTPALVWPAVDVYTEVLYNHIRLKPADPHDITAVQLNANTSAQSLQLINTKQTKGSTVENANTILYQGTWNTYDTYASALRQNLDTSMFPNGVLAPGKMATGPQESTSVMRGDRRWSRVTDILAEKVPGGTSLIYYGAYPHNDLSIVHQTIATTTPFAYAPVSSIYVAQTIQKVQQGYGNGQRHYDVIQRAVFIMSQSGWVLV